jgi:hypothetical protein
VGDYLQQVLEEAKQKLSAEQHGQFLRAIKMSTRIDIDYLDAHQKQFPHGNRKAEPVRKPRARLPQAPNVDTVEAIQKATGFDSKDMAEFRIALTRPNAFRYLSGLTSLRKTIFERDFTVETYIGKFGMNAFDMGRNRLLLTYAQWIHFVGLPINPSLPDLGNNAASKNGGER